MEALSEGVLVITGGPGTGKTTIINTLLDILEGMDEEVLLAAPTGYPFHKKICQNFISIFEYYGDRRILFIQGVKLKSLPL